MKWQLLKSRMNFSFGLESAADLSLHDPCSLSSERKTTAEASEVRRIFRLFTDFRESHCQYWF
jgi:hypothetical protein